MAGLLPFGISLLEAVAEELIGPIFVRSRSIGGFVADVTVRERHRDELTVTENPVEQGADITDHAFKRPPTLVVEVGYSNSSPAAAGDPNYVSSVYDQFLTLQASREPFQVVTGKRVYEDMLITGLTTLTDQVWENASIFTVEMKNVILVETQTVTVPSSASMANPSVNGATQNVGPQQLGSGASFNSSAAPPSQGFAGLQ